MDGGKGDDQEGDGEEGDGEGAGEPVLVGIRFRHTHWPHLRGDLLHYGLEDLSKMWVGWGTETQIKSQNLAEQKKSLFDYQIYGVGGWTFSQIITCFLSLQLLYKVG